MKGQWEGQGSRRIYRALGNSSVQWSQMIIDADQAAQSPHRIPGALQARSFTSKWIFPALCNIDSETSAGFTDTRGFATDISLIFCLQYSCTSEDIDRVESTREACIFVSYSPP